MVGKSRFFDKSKIQILILMTNLLALARNGIFELVKNLDLAKLFLLRTAEKVSYPTNIASMNLVMGCCKFFFTILTPAHV